MTIHSPSKRMPRTPLDEAPTPATALEPALPGIAAWRESGRFVNVHGDSVFVVERGDKDAPALLILHGYPTSSHDYAVLLDRLATRFRVVVHDHLGFGLSARPADYSYSLLEQAEVALGLWSALGIRRGRLVAHDYGTSVATELLARRERGGISLEIEALTLCNGSVHLELAKPRLIQWLLANPFLGPSIARLSTRSTYARNMRAILSRPEVLTEADIDTQWALLTQPGGREVLSPITGYLYERKRFHRRWIGALTRFDRPIQILWGDQDPVARFAVAEQLLSEIPGAHLDRLSGIGHYPMLEDPERWTAALLRFHAE